MSRADSTARSAPAGMSPAFVVGGGALLAAVLLVSRWLAGDVGDTLTRNTVRLSLAWYAAALGLAWIEARSPRLELTKRHQKSP